MKKLAICLIVLLLPMTALAMEAITDGEMDNVTGQEGVSIAVVDFEMDLYVDMISWGDRDSTASLGGTRYWVAGHSVSFYNGWINIKDFAMTKVFVTLAGTLDTSVSAPMGVPADPLKIDVATLSDNASHSPFPGVRGDTAIVFTMPDMLLQIEEIRLGGIYLNDTGKGNTAYEFAGSVDRFLSTDNAVFTTSDSLGFLKIQGVTMRTYSSVEGYENDGTRSWTNHPSRVYILAH